MTIFFATRIRIHVFLSRSSGSETLQLIELRQRHTLNCKDYSVLGKMFIRHSYSHRLSALYTISYKQWKFTLKNALATPCL